MSESTTRQLNERICVFCSNTFIPIRKWQLTCNYECGYRYQNSKKPRPINTKQCLRCGNNLTNKRGNAIYCSRTCKSMDHTFKHKNRGGKPLTTARRRLIIERDGSTCYLCQDTLNLKNVELDHLIPRSRGGDSSPNNLSVSCLRCNRSRGNRIGIEQLNRLRELRDSNDY